MKKLISSIIVSLITFTNLLIPSVAFADHPCGTGLVRSPIDPHGCVTQAPITTIAIVPPADKGYTDLGKFVSNILVLAFGVGIIVVLLMLIWGAFEWILSGGDKEAVGKARGRIINALIGLGVLSVAFALAKLAGQFLGFDITRSIPVPGPLSP